MHAATRCVPPCSTPGTARAPAPPAPLPPAASSSRHRRSATSLHRTWRCWARCVLLSGTGVQRLCVRGRGRLGLRGVALMLRHTCHPPSLPLTSFPCRPSPSAAGAPTHLHCNHTEHMHTTRTLHERMAGGQRAGQLCARARGRPRGRQRRCPHQHCSRPRKQECFRPWQQRSPGPRQQRCPRPWRLQRNACLAAWRAGACGRAAVRRARAAEEDEAGGAGGRPSAGRGR